MASITLNPLDGIFFVGKFNKRRKQLYNAVRNLGWQPCERWKSSFPIKLLVVGGAGMNAATQTTIATAKKKGVHWISESDFVLKVLNAKLPAREDPPAVAGMLTGWVPAPALFPCAL